MGGRLSKYTYYSQLTLFLLLDTIAHLSLTVNKVMQYVTLSACLGSHHTPEEKEKKE